MGQVSPFHALLSAPGRTILINRADRDLYLDRKPGPSLTLDLSNNNNNNSSAAQSNNPFRNPRTASPAIPSPGLATPRSAPINPERPVSRNPFLASFEQDLGNLARKSPLQEMMDGKDKEQVKLQVTDDSDVKELFVGQPLSMSPPVQLTPVNFSRPLAKTTAPTEMAIDAAVDTAMDKFRQFSKDFADYPALQDKLTLKDTAPAGKSSLVILISSELILTIEQAPL